MFEGITRVVLHASLHFRELLQKPVKMEGKPGGKKKRAGEGKKVYQMEKAFPNLFQGGTTKEFFFPPLMSLLDGKSKHSSKRISIIKKAALKQALEGCGVFEYAEAAIGEGIFKAKQLHIPDYPEETVQFGMTLVDRVQSGKHSSKGPFYLLFQVSSQRPQAQEIIPGKFYVCGFVSKNSAWEVTTDPRMITFQGDVKTESLPASDPSHAFPTLPEAKTLCGPKEETYDLLQESKKNKCGVTNEASFKMQIETMEEKTQKLIKNSTTTEMMISPESEVQEKLEACSSSQPQNIFRKMADFWYKTCNEYFKVSESLPFEIFMKAFIRRFYSTINDKNISSLTNLLVNQEMVVTRAAFMAFLTLCCSEKGEFNEDMLQQLSESSCFLAISQSTTEILLHSYDVQPGEALWLVRYSLRRPGVLFLSWYTPNDKNALSHEEIKWSKEETPENSSFSSQVKGSFIHGRTLKELARNILAKYELVAVQCPMAWLQRITSYCASQLPVLKNEESQRRGEQAPQDTGEDQ